MSRPNARRGASILSAVVVTGALGVTGSAGVATAAPAKVPLVLYAAEGYDAAVGKAFTQATGIPVKVDDNSTGPLTVQIEAEKNNPKWNLFWVDGATVFASLDQQGLLAKGVTPTAYKDYNAVGKAQIPADHSYVPTGVTMAAALVYDTKTVPDPPNSWAALTSSKWKGLVGMNDPSVSGPTYPYVAGMMADLGGVKQGESFYSKLKSDGLHVYQTNTNTLQALQSGTIKLATIQSSAGTGAGFSDKSIKVKYLKPETVLPSAIAISAKTSGVALAESKEFINWVLSHSGQHVMQTGDPTGDSLFWPLQNGEKPLKPLPPLSSVPTQHINPSTWGAKQASIDSWFTQNVVQ